MYESNSKNDPSLLRRLTGHRGEVTGISFHPDCMQLVSSSTDSNLILWNLKKHAHAIKFENHSDQVTDVYFLPNAKAFASSSKDRSLRLWKPSNNKVNKLRNPFLVYKTFELGIASKGTRKTDLLMINSKSKAITAHTSAVRSVHVSADSTNLLSASNDKNIKMWMSEYNNKFISTFKGHTHWVNCARFSLDGKYVVSCSEDKTAKLWDRHTNCLIHTFDEKVVPKYVEFHPNNKCVGIAFANGHIKIYDIRNHKLLQFYCGHQQSVNKIAFHPSGNFYISGSSDGLVNVYDIVEGRVIYTLEGHDGAVTALAFSPDGELFATAGTDKTVFVWNTNFHNCLARPLEANSRTVDARLSCMGTEQPEVDVSCVQDSPTEEKIDGFDSLPTDETYSTNGDSSENPLPIKKRNNLHAIERSNEVFHSRDAVDSRFNGGGDATAKPATSDLEKVTDRVHALKLEVKSLHSELEEIMKTLETFEIRQKKLADS